MKKVLTALLASAIMFVGTTNVFADEDANPTTGQVDLIASKGSAYYLQIPMNVDVSNEESTFDILIKGDVDTAMKLTIVEDKGTNGQDVNYLVDNADDNNKFALTATDSGAVNGADIVEDYDEAKVTFTLSHDDLVAGSYSCQFPIKISLSKIS